MAKEKDEQVVEQTTEQPKVDDTVEKIKVKEKPSMKKFNDDTDGVIKVDLSKPPKTEEDAVQKQDADEVPVRDESETSEEVREGDDKGTDEKPTEEKEEKQEVVIEEITDEEEQEVTVEATKEQVEEAVAEAEKTGEPLPENIQKLMNFMNETGGDINDYVKLNQDYTKFDDTALLREYYKQTKSHLISDEVDFLMEDQFAYD